MELFTEAKTRKNNINFIATLNVDEECTFQPNYTINRKSMNSEKEKDKLFKKLSISKEDAKERINREKAVSIEKKQKIREDAKNKRVQFSQLNKKINVPIGELLYRKSKIITSNDSVLQKIENKSFTSENSSKMFQKRKLNSFKEIFHLLDSDKDGKISYNNMLIEGNILSSTTEFNFPNL